MKKTFHHFPGSEQGCPALRLDLVPGPARPQSKRRQNLGLLVRPPGRAMPASRPWESRRSRFRSQVPACAPVGRHREQSGAGQKSECPSGAWRTAPLAFTPGASRTAATVPPPPGRSRTASDGESFHRILRMAHEPESIMDDRLARARHMRQRRPGRLFIAMACDIRTNATTTSGNESTISSHRILRSLV